MHFLNIDGVAPIDPLNSRPTQATVNPIFESATHRVRSHDEQSAHARRQTGSSRGIPMSAPAVNTESFPWLAENPVVHGHQPRRASVSIYNDDYITCDGDEVQYAQPSQAIYATSVPSDVDTIAPRRHTRQVPAAHGDEYEAPVPVHVRSTRLDSDLYVSDSFNGSMTAPRRHLPLVPAHGDEYEEPAPVNAGPRRLDRDLYVSEKSDTAGSGSTVRVPPMHHAGLRSSISHATSHQISRPRRARDSNA